MDVGLLDDFLLPILMRDAPANRLIPHPEVAVQPIGWRADPLRLPAQRVVAHNRVFDVGHDLLPRHGFDVMSIDVADEPVLQAALECVAPGMR